MNARKIVAGIAISAAVVLGTTGCSLTHNVDSLQAYAPSDGSQLNIGTTAIRNVIYLNNGSTGKLIGSVVNNSTKEITFSVQYADFDQTLSTEPITVSAGETLALGSNPSVPGLEVTMAGKPGDNIEIYVSIDGATGVALTVPVLDGSLEQYAPYFTN
jgi:hypothetical protein